jgi:protein transport protein SEC20
LLEQSSANLRSTTAAHDILSTLLSTSKHLITALEKSDWLDRLLILSAVAFFFLVVLFILKQRVIDKGIRIAFWWTRFIPNFSGDAELLKANIVGTGAGTVLATVTATTSSVASSLLATATTGIHSTPPGLDIEETLSAPAPSDSNLPASNAEEMDDAIQDIISSTAKPSPSPSISETSTILPNDKPRNHQEL